MDSPDVICPQCGAPNEAGLPACLLCRAPLPGAAPAPLPPPGAAPPAPPAPTPYYGYAPPAARPAPPPARRNGLWLGLALGGVVGLVVLIGAIGLLWALGGGRLGIGGTPTPEDADLLL